jgi:hypothetical protein
MRCYHCRLRLRKRSITDGCVEVTVGVAKERFKTADRVVAPRSIAKQRERSVGGVLAPDGIA